MENRMRKASTKFREEISPRAGSLQLHQPKPKTFAERGRAFRERQRNKSAVRSAKAAPSPAEPVEKSRTFANGAPKFAELEKSTAELVAACQRGIEAARLVIGRGASLEGSAIR